MTNLIDASSRFRDIRDRLHYAKIVDEFRRSIEQHKPVIQRWDSGEPENAA